MIIAITATSVAMIATTASAQPSKRAASERATHGKTQKELAAQRMLLRDRLRAETPTRVRKRRITVALTDQDRATLEEPSVGAVPLRIGLVKALAPEMQISNGAGLEQGVSKATADGGFVWAVSFTSPGAQAIRLHLTDVSLPDAARLYFYAPDGQAYGPYSGKGRSGNGDFWTHSIASSTGVLQLRYEGKASEAERRKISFTVAGLGHIHGRGPVAEPQSHDEWPCRTNPECIVDANCVDGTPADVAKSAIAKMEWIEGNYIYSCSGGLIADTDPSTQIPYFLTANHCLTADTPNLETFFFYETDSCNGACPDALLTGGTPPTPSTIGATIQATGLIGDFSLFTLDEDPPADTTFLGWNNAPIAFTNGAQLYRISNPNFGPQAFSQHRIDTGRPVCGGWPRGERIYTSIVSGATMGGSSGAPVLNGDSEVVGQLSGCCGFNCADPCDGSNNATVDGALAYYWPKVAPFLDPSLSCNDDGACNADEDCHSCPGDCRQQTGGAAGTDFCCNGDLIQPDCGDARCSESGWYCDPGAECGTDPDCPPGRIMLDTASVTSKCAGAPNDTVTLPGVTVGPQANRVLVVTAGAEENDGDCDFAHADAVATYGGIPLAKAATALSDQFSWRTCSAIFYLLAPPSGTADIVIQFPHDTGSSINNRHVGAFVLYGAAQQAPEVSSSQGADNGADPVYANIDVFTERAWVVDAIVQGNLGTFAPTEFGQTELWQRSCSSSSMAASTLEATSAGLHTLGWDHSTPSRFAHALAVFKPATGIGTTTTTLAPTTTTVPFPTTTTTTTPAPTTTLPVTTTTTTVPAPTTTLPITTTTTTTTTTLPVGQISFDPVSLASRCAGASDDTVTLSGVTVGTQANRVLVVTAAAEENDSDCDFAHVDAVATYAGIPLQKAATAVSDLNSWRTCSAVFYLLAPPPGTADVVIVFPQDTSSAINNRHVGAFVLYGAAQQAPENAASNGADNSTNPVVSTIDVLTPQAWIVDAFVRGNLGSFTATETGQTERWQRSCSSSSMATSTRQAASPGPYSVGWDHSNPSRYAHALAVFAAAPIFSGSTTTTMAPTTTVPVTTTSTTTTTTLGPTTTLPASTTTLPAGTTTTMAPTTTVPVTTTTTTTLPVGQIMLDASSLASKCAGALRDTETLADVSVGTQANRVLVVTAGAEENDADCNFAHADAVATYGGVPLQKAATAVSDTSSWRTCSAVFYLLAPPSGTADVVVSFPQTTASAINDRHVGAFVLYGAAQRAPESAASNGADNRLDPIATDVAVLTPNAWVVDAFIRGNLGSFTATEPGQIERWQRSCSSSSMAASTREAAAPGLVTMGWDHSNPSRFAHALAVFAPATP